MNSFSWPGVNPVRTGFTPGQENEFMIKWLKGEHIKIKV